MCLFHSNQNLLTRDNWNAFFIFCYGDEKTKIGPKVQKSHGTEGCKFCRLVTKDDYAHMTGAISGC